MSILLIAFTLGSLFADGGALPLPVPTVISSSGGVLEMELGVEEYRFETEKAGFNTRAYCYPIGVCSVPGPTLVVRPGDHVSLKLVNMLDVGQARADVTNGPHLPDSTNLHIHGVHISSLQDQVLIEVEPQSNYTYEYDIEPDHQPGVFWYHPHLHGSVHLQLHGGMYGAFIVLPSQSATVPPELSVMKSSVALITHLQLTTMCSRRRLPADDLERRRLLPNNGPTMSHCLMSMLTGDTLDFGFTGETGEWMIANGVHEPTVVVAPDEWHVLNLINIQGHVLLELELEGCEMAVLAYDGTYLDAPREVTVAVLAQGARVDLAVKCPAGTHKLFSNKAAERDAELSNAPRYAGTEAILFLDASGPSTGASALPPALIAKPGYLADLRGQESDALIARKWKLAYGQEGAEVASWDQGVLDMDSFDGETYLVASDLGDILEWSIGPDFHPHHQHAYHVQLQEDIAGGLLGKAGDWRDTVASGVYTRVRVRVDKFCGPIPIHCHQTKHADDGMMGIWVVRDPQDPVCTAANAAWKDPGFTAPSADTPGAMGVGVLVAIILGAMSFLFWIIMTVLRGSLCWPFVTHAEAGVVQVIPTDDK